MFKQCNQGCLNKIFKIMKKILLIVIVLVTACTSTKTGKDASIKAGFINEAVISASLDTLKSNHPAINTELAGKGIKHAASLWRAESGTPAEFIEFVRQNYVSDPAKRREIFKKITLYLESVYGNFDKITLDLRKVLDENLGEIDGIDKMFGNYSVGSHLQNDFYANKIAFVIALNFPYYTLAEKEKLGSSWNREEWAMARLGDQFVLRVPAELDQKLATATGNAEIYISEYNIHMGHLRSENGRKLFPDDMVLLSHWNLRDELKADYADKKTGLEKQEMISKVMERIINQEIPKQVINNPEFEWAPFSNKITKGGLASEAVPEPDTRYAHIINIFRAMKEIDAYCPEMNTAVLRKFSFEMEISQNEVETLFDSYMKSSQLAMIGKLIKERLGRDLRPYDIWYNGFQSRSTISEDQLSAKTSALYPNPPAFRAAMPGFLEKLGWTPDRARYIADKIVVDPARGSGHAWGTPMKGAVSHLRTRISDKGMDYKGYNIAVHEFGHNVEQTISMYDVDKYMMSGVPNTALTEALAFVFQSRDLFLLGIRDENPEKEKMSTLNEAWSLMEIMGVGMVDMKTWKWLYENPTATPSQLKENVKKIAVDIWNKYFAPVIGVKDSPLLAIYSHMVDSPLYLANYSYGQIVHFQIEEYIKGKKFSDEIERIYSQGRLTPQQWMTGAVGARISAQPLLDALNKALGK